MSKKITPRATDPAKWYTELIQRAELADYSPVRGCLVIRPNGYAIWEKIQTKVDQMIKATGHRNLYFPLFIPQSFLQREAEHVEGFAPELAVVTHGGGHVLEEPLVVRPTSETMIWHMYKKWINSYRDLPLLYNQWANVVRWEMRTRPFIRTTEFLWQEGHTAHASEEEARSEALLMLETYRTLCYETLCIPVITGVKTANEKFAGAVDTYTLEGLMQDGKALQIGTSHYLGQNFARAFDVTFQTEKGSLEYVYATSWGVTTRLIGACIMVHGDDQGLVLPPALAEYPIVIVPIGKTEDERQRVMTYAQQIRRQLSAWNTHFDDRPDVTPGFKFNEWELRGIPLRIEIGPREVEREQVVLVRRDTREKSVTAIAPLHQVVEEKLNAIQTDLLTKATAERDAKSHHVETYSKLKKLVDEDAGFLYAYWCGESSCELKVAEETRATIRAIPFDQPKEGGRCIYCGNRTKQQVIFARAY